MASGVNRFASFEAANAPEGTNAAPAQPYRYDDEARTIQNLAFMRHWPLPNQYENHGYLWVLFFTRNIEAHEWFELRACYPNQPHHPRSYQLWFITRMGENPFAD